MLSTGLAVVAAVAVIVLLLLRSSIKIAREYQRYVVFRLGRSLGQKGPGVVCFDKIFTVAHTVDANTMSLQYLETFKALGAGPASKFIFPMEFTRLLEPLFNHKSGA